MFITRDGLVKILDFGLAKLTEAIEGLPGAMSTTAPGVVLGTVGYMAPEQARGEPSDARSDIFSFGAMLYEMLSGERAFQGNSSVETLSAILGSSPSISRTSFRGSHRRWRASSTAASRRTRTIVFKRHRTWDSRSTRSPASRPPPSLHPDGHP